MAASDERMVSGLLGFGGITEGIACAVASGIAPAQTPEASIETGKRAPSSLDSTAVNNVHVHTPPWRPICCGHTNHRHTCLHTRTRTRYPPEGYTYLVQFTTPTGNSVSIPFSASTRSISTPATTPRMPS